MTRKLVNWIDDSGQNYANGTITIEESPFRGGVPAEGDSVAAVSALNTGSSGIWVLGDVSNPTAVPVTRRDDMQTGVTVVSGELFLATVVKDTVDGRILLLYANDGVPQPEAVVGTDYFNLLPVQTVFLG